MTAAEGGGIDPALAGAVGVLANAAAVVLLALAARIRRPRDPRGRHARPDPDEEEE